MYLDLLCRISKLDDISHILCLGYRCSYGQTGGTRCYQFEKDTVSDLIQQISDFYSSYLYSEW